MTDIQTDALPDVLTYVRTNRYETSTNINKRVENAEFRVCDRQVCPRSKVPLYLGQFPGGRSRSRDTGQFFIPDRGGGIEALSRSCP